MTLLETLRDQISERPAGCAYGVIVDEAIKGAPAEVVETLAAEHAIRPDRLAVLRRIAKQTAERRAD